MSINNDYLLISVCIFLLYRMKRVHDNEDNTPFESLLKDPLVRPFIIKWSESEGTFPIDELPIEIVIKIVYEHLDILLAIFALNTRLNAIQEMKGFWSGLFKVAFKPESIMLSVFLNESPELTRLDAEAMTDVIALSSAFNNFDLVRQFRLTKRQVPNLWEIESSLIRGDVNILEIFYLRGMDKSGNTSSQYYLLSRTHNNTIVVTLRRSLIQFYILLKEAQLNMSYIDILSKVIEIAETTFKSLPNNNEDNETTVFSQDRMFNLLDYWIKELHEQKMPRFEKYYQAMLSLKEEFRKEMDIIFTPDVNTGKIPTYNTLYVVNMENLFQSYFGLSDEEARKQWKKLFVQTHINNDVGLLLETTTLTLHGCAFCHKNEKLSLDTKFNITFCDKACQQHFKNHFID